VGLAYCLSSPAISIFLIPAPSPNPFIDLLLLFRRMGLAVSYDHDEVGYWQAHSYLSSLILKQLRQSSQLVNQAFALTD
jgi:hypothetical protein